MVLRMYLPLISPRMPGQIGLIDLHLSLFPTLVFLRFDWCSMSSLWLREVEVGPPSEAVNCQPFLLQEGLGDPFPLLPGSPHETVDPFQLLQGPSWESVEPSRLFLDVFFRVTIETGVRSWDSPLLSSSYSEPDPPSLDTDWELSDCLSRECNHLATSSLVWEVIESSFHELPTHDN